MSKPLSKIVRWVLVAFAVGLLSCLIIGNRKGRRMSQCVIAFPDSLECIYDGIALTRHLDVAAPPAYKLVMVVDSLQCSYCKIGRLQRYKDLFEESPHPSGLGERVPGHEPMHSVRRGLSFVPAGCFGACGLHRRSLKRQSVLQSVRKADRAGLIYSPMVLAISRI